MGCSIKDNSQSGVTITGNTASIKGHIVIDEAQVLSRTIAVVGSGLDSIVVYLKEETDSFPYLDSMLVDSMGGYFFDSLPGGTYSLYAWLLGGEVLSHEGIILKSGEDVIADLIKRGTNGGDTLPDKGDTTINGGDTLLSWAIELEYSDTTSGLHWPLLLYGPSKPLSNVSVRRLEQSMFSYSGPFSSGVSVLGTKIAIQFPLKMVVDQNKVQILVGVQGWNGSAPVSDNSSAETAKIIWHDANADRRLLVSWGSKGPYCILLDSVQMPHVSCKEYEAPKLTPLSKVESEVGPIFRDLANRLGVNDLVKGYVFHTNVVRGGSTVASMMLKAKLYWDGLGGDADLMPNSSGDFINEEFYDSIPLRVFEGLNADSIIDTISIGEQLNNSSYWNEVPGVFFNSRTTPYQTSVVGFESPGSQVTSSNAYPHYKDIGNGSYAYLRKFENYALLSFITKCMDENVYMLRKNTEGAYELMLEWYYAAKVACD